MTDALQPEPDLPPDPAEDLVFRCLESDDPDRELRAAERDDPALASEARALLAALDSRGLRQERGAAAGLPERLGPYRLVRKLGEGGMGIVVEAVDTELDRRIAIKLIRPDMLPFSNSRQRFENEIQALAKLEHPGIARVLRSGEQDGLRYFAMEFVDGESLARILARLSGKNSTELDGSDLFASAPGGADSTSSERHVLAAAGWVEACVRIARDTARALAHAHDNGILHRDVKPANVMLGQDGRVRLLDFGLARADDTQTMTRSGAALGSLAYMAPEQLQGERQAVDARSDVYALAVLLHELLTLQQPFFVPDNPAATQQRVLDGRARDLRRDNPAVPLALAQICRRAMSPTAANRHATAAQFADALDAALAAGLDRGDAVSPGLVERHPRVVAGVFALLVLAVVGLGIALTVSRPVGDERPTSSVDERSAYVALIRAAQLELAAGHLSGGAALLDRAPESHRSWEWWHLRARTRPGATVHTPPLTSSAWRIGANRERLVFAFSKSNQLSVVHLESGRSFALSKLGLPPAYESSLSADGTVFASIPRSRHDELHVADVDSASVSRFQLDREYQGIRLSADGSRAAMLHADGTITLLDTANADVLGTLSECHGQSWIQPRGYQAAWSPDGKWLAAGLRNGEIVVFDVTARRLQWRAHVEFGAVTWVVFDAGCEHLATLSQHECLELWRVVDGERVHSKAITNRKGGSGDMPPTWRAFPDLDSGHVWTVGFDGMLRCLHLDSGRWLQTTPLHDLSDRNPWVPTALFDAGSDTLVASNRYRGIWRHDVRSAAATWLHCGAGLVRGARNGRGDLVATGQSIVPVFRPTAGEARRLDVPPTTRALFVSHDLVAIAPVEDSAVLLYDLSTDNVVGRLETESPVDSLLLMNDCLLTGSVDGAVGRWNLESRTRGQVYDRHEDKVTEIIPMPDGEHFVTASFDGSVRMHAFDGATTRTILSTPNRCYTVAVSPDGRWLVAGGRYKGQQIYDLREDRLRPDTLTKSSTSAAVFTPDGKRVIVSSHAHGRLELFDTTTWQHVLTIEAGDNVGIHEIGFAPDGATLITGDNEGLVRLWQAER